MASNARAIVRALKATRGSGTPASFGGYGNAPGPSLGPSPSPLVMSYSEWVGGREYGQNAALPRAWETFLSGAYGPLEPIKPVPIDTPLPGEERPEPRIRHYPVGWDMPMGPPGSEGWGKLTNFESLRTLADSYSVARACLQLRRNELRGLGWDIGPTRSAAKAMRGDHKAARDFAERRAEVVRFFRHPDPNYQDFTSWFTALVEDMLVIDAPSLYMHPPRVKGKGVLGTNLAALELIDGAMIRPLVDIRGGKPPPPNPAFQQFDFGVPRVDLMTMILEQDIPDSERDKMVAEYRGDQLLYLPMNPRSWCVYGMSPIEQGIIPAMSGLAKQKYALDFFQEGCYSDDTEILTRDGWKLFAKLADDDEVATRSEDGRFEWQKPTTRQCYPFDGEMVEFSNKAVNLLVTPNHRMLLRRLAEKGKPTGKDHEWHIRPAGYCADYPAARFEVPVTSRWAGVQPPADFELAGRPSNRRRPAHERATEWLAGILTEPWTPAAEVWAAAKTAGVKERALGGARRNLGVKMRRVGFGPGCRWDMSAPTREHVPAGSWSHVPLRGFRMPMKGFCSFLGLFLAEGWVVDGREDIIVAQTEKSRHLPEIQQILEATGLRWIYDPKRAKFTTQHKVLSEWLRDNTGHLAWGKHVPAAFKDFPPEYLEAMLRGMMIGDGTWTPIGRRQYHTTSSRLADDVQEIFQKLGIDSWISSRKRTKSERSALVRGTFGFHRIYRIAERMRDVHRLPRPRRREYHGNVYCVSVPNGIVYVRRNGRAAWCGNSIPGAYISVGDPGQSPSQIQEWQTTLNAIAGDQAWKHKVIALPGGSKVDPQKPVTLADAFDAMVQIEMCMALDIQPYEIGAIPNLAAAAAAGGPSGSMARTQVQATRKPTERPANVALLLFLKACVFDRIIQMVFGQHDMEIQFEGLEEAENAAEITDMAIEQIGSGLLSIDEGRQMIGRDPWGLPITSDPVWATQWGGAVPLTGIAQATAQPQGGSPSPQAGGQKPSAAVDFTRPGAVSRGGAPSPSTPATHAGLPRNQQSRGQRRRQAAGVSGTQAGAQRSPGTPAHSGARAERARRPAAASKGVLAERVRELLEADEPPLDGEKAARELSLLKSHLNRGGTVTEWERRFLPPRALAVVSEHLAKGLDAGQACEMAQAVLTGELASA